MIIDFSVKNFKCIKDEVTLSFRASKSDDLEEYYVSKPNEKHRLLKLGVIYGANASGKTTILDALDFLREIVVTPFKQKYTTLDFSPFLFDSQSSNQNTFFTLSFIAEQIKYLYQVEMNQNCILNESLYIFKPKKALLFQRKTDEEKKVATIKWGDKVVINKTIKTLLLGNTLWNTSVFGGYLRTNFESIELQNAFDWFASHLKSKITPKSELTLFFTKQIKRKKISKNLLLKILNIADFNVCDIQFEARKIPFSDDLIRLITGKTNLSKAEIEQLKKNGQVEIDLFFQHSVDNDKYMLPFEAESAGTQRYYELACILAMLIQTEVIYPIDEIESSIHPDLLKHFLLSFITNSKNSQLIVTTHLRELLMEKEIFRNDVIWFTEKKSDGSTDLFNLTDFDSSVVRNTSSIYNAYKIGKLGAVPDLKDYYIELEDE